MSTDVFSVVPATGTEPQEIDQMPRPTLRKQLGTPDDALGTLDPDPVDQAPPPPGRHHS